MAMSKQSWSLELCYLEARNTQTPQKAKKQGGSTPTGLGGSLVALPALWFQTCSLQKCERIDLCWFKPLSLWWFVTASPRKPACEIRLVFNQLEFRSGRSTQGLEDNVRGLSLWVKWAFWSSEAIMTGYCVRTCVLLWPPQSGYFFFHQMYCKYVRVS